MFNWEFTTCKNDIGFGVFYISLKDTRRLLKLDGSVELSASPDCCEMLNGERKLRKRILKYLKHINFDTGANDDGFSVSTGGERGDNSPVENFRPSFLELHKPDRVQSHIIPEQGAIECRHPGLYVAVFDNRYSILRSKEGPFALHVSLRRTSRMEEVRVMVRAISKRE